MFYYPQTDISNPDNRLSIRVPWKRERRRPDLKHDLRDSQPVIYLALAFNAVGFFLIFLVSSTPVFKTRKHYAITKERLAYEGGGNCRRTVWIKPLKETDLGVAKSLFDPLKETMLKHRQIYMLKFSSRTTLSETFRAKYNGVFPTKVRQKSEINTLKVRLTHFCTLWKSYEIMGLFLAWRHRLICIVDNLVPRVLSLPWKSTLVTACHVSMHANWSHTEGRSSTWFCQHSLGRWMLRCYRR